MYKRFLSSNVLAALFVVTLILLVETPTLNFLYSGLFGVDIHLNQAQLICAAILLIAAVLWISEWVPLFVVSFLILAMELVWLNPALAQNNTIVDASIYFSSFFSNIILLFLGGFVLSALMQKFGLDIRFAQAILEKTHGNAKFTLLGIIIACAFLSMWVSNTATTAMMLTIVFPLIKKIPSEHPFRIALVLSIPFACNIGGIGTPIGTPPNAIALSYLSKNGLSLSFFQWIALMLPFVCLFLLLLWQLLLKLYPPKGITLELESRSTGEFTARHIFAISIFLLTALGWFFGSSIGLKTGTVALLPIVACFWFGLLDTDDFRKLPWDILYIISGGLALGVALNASGLDAVIVSLLPTDTNPTSILALGVVVAGIMSTVMSNTATAGLVIPLVMSLQFQGSFLVSLVLALALMCSMAMALPVTTPPNAIAFSSRVLKTKDMMVAGGIMSLIGLVIIIVFGPFYWNLILG